ncbi:hypothetical protein WSK_2031 [Novosphingobium sp. Rr 2-17]|nr:hypothetical protein WSK_2031 [Novosphingobium sp. Rr 2-17]
MAKPKRYLADIPRRLKHMHGTAMPQNVRRYCLGTKRWDAMRCLDRMLSEDIFESRAGHRPARAVQEQRGVATDGPNGDPGANGGYRLLPKWQHAFSPAFAHDMNAGRGPPVELPYIEADKFGNAQSAGECQMKHGAIAYAEDGSSIGSIVQRLHLKPRQ